MKNLLIHLKEKQKSLSEKHHKYVPLAVKIAPDLKANEIANMAKLFLTCKIDAVIATNTTLSRQGVAGMTHADEAGGLSGAPLDPLANNVIVELKKHLKDNIPIIGVGGILSADDAQQKLKAGASLLQTYTGLIYKGPGLIKEIIKACQQFPDNKNIQVN